MDRPPNDWVIATPAGRDFAEAYLSSKQALRAATDAVLTACPAFAFVLASLDEEARAANYESYWQGAERALHGDWSARAAALTQTAKEFVRAGAGTAEWEALSVANTGVVRRALFARHAGEPERFLAACDVLQQFFDRSFVAFCEALGLAADRQLQQSERLFRLMPVGQAVFDAEGILRKANDAFLQLCSIARAGMHQHSLGTLFGEAAWRRFQWAYAGAEQAARVAYDDSLLTPERTVPVRIEAACLDAEAQGVVWGVALHDLTERRHLETLALRSAQLEAENHRMSAASEAKSSFLANMSHELRTPMNAILGFSQLLAAGEVGPLTETQQEFVVDIAKSGQHLLRLINDILDLSKVEAGKLELYPEDVDLRALTDETVELAMAAVPPGGVTVATRVDPQLARAHLDPSRYKQVLLNYLSNAIKFSPAGGHVFVTLSAEDGECFRVTVRDEGPGIADADVPRLFHTFEQLDAGRAKRHGGTGLGLALTKKLVESQGGTVGVRRETDRGCSFHAVLPLRTSPAASLPPSE